MIMRARKRFGQHFLSSTEVIEQIVAAIQPKVGDTIVEIGPGQAAITDPLAASGANLHAVEFDRDLVALLSKRFAQQEKVTVHEADALKFDFSSIGKNLRVVGNLPYNISTPLLFHLLTYRKEIVDAHFMLQKEVVDRLCAAPGNKSYGRLTIMLGCQMEVVPLFCVPPEAFSPPPKVTSAVIRMRPIPGPGHAIKNAKLLADIVRAAFSQRRKTLRNALQGKAHTDDLEAVGIAASDRPEQVSIADWVKLANHLTDVQMSDN
jgi:16S rRNA (adenine1518-N6/adenine1519-N6)-dimethyltransferase